MLEQIYLLKEQLLGLSFYHIAVGYVVIRLFNRACSACFMVINKRDDEWKNKASEKGFSASLIGVYMTCPNERIRTEIVESLRASFVNGRRYE